MTLAFMPQSIRTYFGDGESLGMDIDYSVEEQPLGTAGSVRLAHARLDDTFIVISGDALCDVDLTALVEAHRAKGAAVTIGLKSVENPLEFGIVVTDEDGRVERFLEKPSWGQVFSDTINTGIYVLEPEVLRHVPDDRPYDFSKELFPLLLEMGRPLYGHVLDGYWQDIGNLEQFRQANFDALDAGVHLDVPGLRLRGNVWVSEEVDINEVEGVEGPAFIGANCRIADGASIGPYSVLSQGVIVREGARVTRSVVDAGTYLGRSSVVEGAIVGRGCDLRDHVRVHEGVAIGDQVTIGAGGEPLPGRPGLPVQGDRDRRADPRERGVGDHGHHHALRPRRRQGARQRRPDPRDRRPPRCRARHRAQARRPRRREPCVAGRVPHDPARDHRRAHVDGCARRRPADLACRGDPPRPQDPGAPGGHPRGALERRPGGHPRPGLRVAGEPDDRGSAEGGREALQPPGAPPRDVRGGGGDDLPGTRPGQLRAGHPRRTRCRVDPPPPFPRGGRLRLLARGVHASARARPARRRGDRRPRVLRRGRNGGGARADRRPPDRDRRPRRSRSRPRSRRRAARRRRRTRRGGAGRSRAPARRPAARPCRPLGADRGADHHHRPGRAARRGLAADGRPDAALAERAHTRRDRGRGGARGGADRRLRLPRRRPGLRRRDRPLQAPRAAGDPGAARLASSSPTCRARRSSIRRSPAPGAARGS